MSPGRILPAKATRTRRLREGFIEDDGPFGLDSLPYLRLKCGRALTNTPRSSGPGNGVHSSDPESPPLANLSAKARRPCPIVLRYGPQQVAEANQQLPLLWPLRAHIWSGHSHCVIDSCFHLGARPSRRSGVGI